MKTLITPTKVINLAFSQTEQATCKSIKDVKIVVAQERYIRPALGCNLYEALLNGEYADFAEEYISPALAMYVRYITFVDFALKLNDMGAQSYVGINGTSASSTERSEARTQIRLDADTLLNSAIEYIQQNINDFPEYEYREVKQRVHRAGGLIL